MGLLAWVIFVFAVTLPSYEGKKICFHVRGIIPPVFTPMDEFGRVDLDVVPPYAQFLADKGVDGVLVAGTAGEGPALNITDKKNLITAWVEAARAFKLSVTVQVGGIPLPDAQELAAFSQEAGADAILTLPELYYKPETPKELVKFVQDVAQAAPDTPVLYYHIPSYTHVDVDMVEFFRLATQRIPNFKGLKSEDFGTSLMLQDKLAKDQRIFIADSLFLAPAVFMGFENFIITEINLFPKLVKSIVHYGRKGYFNRTRSLYRKLRKLSDSITEDAEGNELAAFKAAMPLCTGTNVGPIRPPGTSLTFEQIIHLEQRLEDAEIEIINSAFDSE